ncbi:MAG: hypothetical protein HRU03_07075 [Nanoarchaeales archaeon]|nr:hypothetical protein [Nanoarchaeales archaeon]
MDTIDEGFLFLKSLEAEFAFKKIPSLEKINFYLDKFDRPELSYKNRIIVTGTAGKGTTCRAIEKILLENNTSTLTLYSPHIQTVLERIRISGKLIEKEFFCEILVEIKKVYEQNETKLSYYECLILVGIIAGKKKECDTLICEVGLGGDFDATNAISGSRYSLLTFIDYDHVDILGHTTEKIADKKLGIVTSDTIKFLTYEKKLKEYFIKNAVVKPKFYEFYEFENEMLAVKVCEEILNKELNKVPSVTLPCRFEKVDKKVILDGAHSKVRFEDVYNKIKAVKGPKVAVIGMVKNHNKDDLKCVLKLFDKIIWTKIDFIREFHDPNELQKHFNCGEVSLNPMKSIQKYEDDYTVIVLGSFYLAGKIRESYISTRYMEENSCEFKKN